MKINRWIVIAVASLMVAGLLVLGNSASHGQAPAAQAVTAWEYKTFEGNIVGANSPLKEFGQEGWELCGIVPGERQAGTLYIFKRPKR
jgi:hypothetical protein